MTRRPDQLARRARIIAPVAAFSALLAVGLPTDARADDDCFAPVSAWMDKDAALTAVSERWGLEPKRLRIDDGCYQIRAIDPDGNRVSLLVDPETLEPVELKVKFRAGADASRYLGSLRADPTPPPASTQDD